MALEGSCGAGLTRGWVCILTPALLQQSGHLWAPLKMQTWEQVGPLSRSDVPPGSDTLQRGSLGKVTGGRCGDLLVSVPGAGVPVALNQAESESAGPGEAGDAAFLLGTAVHYPKETPARAARVPAAPMCCVRNGSGGGELAVSRRAQSSLTWTLENLTLRRREQETILGRGGPLLPCWSQPQIDNSVCPEVTSFHLPRLDCTWCHF